ncbi:MAG: hypothetical protein GEU80_17825 [Dehalococcoidia bacterium]|nr:hypothetical protein [Dehalococcoidia bacterium]
MSKFRALHPDHVGPDDRAEARRPYIEAVRAGDAGRIDLEPHDDPVLVHRLLNEAASELGVRIGSVWADPGRTLLWRRVEGHRVRHG